MINIVKEEIDQSGYRVRVVKSIEEFRNLHKERKYK
jgi:hypothetical protein